MAAIIESQKENVEKNQSVKFNWKENSCVQNLLDVLASILANEFIDVAKRIPKAFSS